MGPTLNINIYGLRAKINCFDATDGERVTRLLALFPKDEMPEAETNLNFKVNNTPQEIGSLLFPHLAGRGIWAMHSGGFHFQGGYLTVGPSDCGKSTFSHMAMENGLDLLSDDITLLRETPAGIEMLPFYSTIFLKNRAIMPDKERYKPAILKFLLLPQPNNHSFCLRPINRKSDLLRRLVPQILWSHNKVEQIKQKKFIEILCHYPAYEVYWNSSLFDDHNLFRMMLDEIVQSEGPLHASPFEG